MTNLQNHVLLQIRVNRSSRIPLLAESPPKCQDNNKKLKIAYRHYWIAADSPEDSELRSLLRATNSLSLS
jgi:hypothetical protein